MGNSSADTEVILEALLYSQRWPPQIRLLKMNADCCHGKYFEPYGLGHPVTGEDVALEHVGDADAISGLDLSEKIDRFALDIGHEMANAAYEKGEKYWREGLTWFDKVSGSISTCRSLCKWRDLFSSYITSHHWSQSVLIKAGNIMHPMTELMRFIAGFLIWHTGEKGKALEIHASVLAGS